MLLQVAVTDEQDNSVPLHIHPIHPKEKTPAHWRHFNWTVLRPWHECDILNAIQQKKTNNVKNNIPFSFYIQMPFNSPISFKCHYMFKPLNAELNPNCKSQLAELFCGVFKFCAWYSQNLNISRTKRDKFVNEKAFCGEGNRHCSECLKNAVISLLRNREDKFLNKLVNNHVLLNTLRSKASTLCTEDRQIDVLQVGLCMVIFKTISINTKRHVTLDTSEYHHSLHAPHWTHATSPFHVTAARPVPIVTCVQSSGVIRSWGWSPYRHGWSYPVESHSLNILMPTLLRFYRDVLSG